MKRLVLSCLTLIWGATGYTQSTYYWIGGAAASPQNISTLTNWNSALDGTGGSRTSSTSPDILIFNGANYGGATLTTGTDSVNMNSGISCAQLRFINGANIVFSRGTSGTSTLTIIGDGTGADDFFIETGSSATLGNGPGSQVIVMGGAGNSGRVNGNFSMITGLQARIANGTSVSTTLTFGVGATFTSNITAASAAYPFGNNTQSTEKWVTFQPGATCYYDGGFSVMGSNATFQPVNFLPGSYFVMRASNPVGSGGAFVNRKAFANVTVQNGATLTADGSINAIDTLLITSGSTVITHTSGQTAILGNLTVHGTLSGAATSTNEVMLAGSTTQVIGGTGTVSIPSLLIADGADVTLAKSIAVNRSATVNGKLDFSVYQLTGSGSFTARSSTPTAAGTGNTTAGSYIITGATGVSALSRGIAVSGTGLSPNTRVISYTTAFDSIYISRPALSTSAGTALSFSATPATLVTSSTAGFEAASGSVVLSDVRSFGPRINYVINAATAAPFGLSSASTSRAVEVGDVLLNAAVNTNATASIFGTLQSTAGKTTISPLDTLWLMPGAVLAGTYGNANYFITAVDAAGATGVLRRDNVTGATVFPIGTPTDYLPVMGNPVSVSSFAVNVFRGITTNGTPTGTPFTPLQKQTVVDAVWNVNRVGGSGDANLQLQWTNALEGTTLATFADAEIGIIRNTGSAWSLPFGTGNNAANTADTVFSTFGLFGAGARPPLNPFVFNALPQKVYGEADFSPGVISSNTTMPVLYTSSNPAVATIVGQNIHITGVGTTVITATQATDGFNAAANVAQTLTVVRAPLTIKADRKIKPEGDPNPVLTATFTGFVLGESAAVFTTPLLLATTATATSPPGSYVITASGASAANYSITFINDSLIVRPRAPQTITFPAFAAKTYGAADFAAGATSTNAANPITYTSSNPAVATIVGNNIRITGAGTATITASQAANDLFFAAPAVSQVLTVARAPLTIRVADTTRMYGAENPPFTILYTGFVLGQNASHLSAQPTVTTAATTLSAPGYHSLTPSGAVAANYNITYVPGRLTIFPPSGTSQSSLQAFVNGNGNLTVRVFSAVPDLGDVFVYDINGRQVDRKNIFIAPGFISTTFTNSTLPAGIFIVRVVGKTTDLKLALSVTR